MTRMHWHPKSGEMKIFEDDEKEPEGWLSTHPSNLAAFTGTADKPKATAATKPAADPAALTRPEIIAALKAGSIDFKITASTVALLGTLTDALVAALKEQGVDPDAIADMSPREMLTAVGAA